MNLVSSILLGVAIVSVLCGVAIVSVLCGVASAVMIAASLQRRGFKVNWVWLRVLILSKYLGQYRNVTRQETGQSGPLFYSYIIAMHLALVAGIAGPVFRAT